MTAPSRRDTVSRSRWSLPLAALALGAVMFAAFAIGDKPGEGGGAFAVMAVVALVFAFGGRSETVRGLGGPGRDERWETIDMRATAFAGMVVLLFACGAWLWEVANGDDGARYAQIAAIGGLAYVAGIAFLRWRS